MGKPSAISCWRIIAARTKGSKIVKILTFILAACLPTSATASPWPILKDPRIVSCTDYIEGPCAGKVMYANSGITMVDVIGVGTPDRGKRLDIIPVGLHCHNGNAMTGVLPFRQCAWASGHAPAIVTKCQLVSHDSWELTADSTCQVTADGGSHTGAGPGGECVMFVQSPRTSTDPLATPWGPVSAVQAANSGNRFCSKPLPPSVTCELQLPSVIDHGPVRAGETSKREDNGSVNCGGSPKIDVLVNGDRDTGGVRITALPFVVNPTTVRITSEINVSSSAVPGEHSATYVFVASPY